MEEIWASIRDFPGYAVSNYGEVINAEKDLRLILSPTQNGELTVGLRRDGHQYRRSVRVLVATEFVEGKTRIFNTAIILDGDRNNLRADNLVWRPRWFSCRYMHQFHDGNDWHRYGPIEDVTTGTVYADYLEAAVANGILCRDIRVSIYNGTPVWPTRQVFRYRRY